MRNHDQFLGTLMQALPSERSNAVFGHHIIDKRAWRSYHRTKCKRWHDPRQPLSIHNRARRQSDNRLPTGQARSDGKGRCPPVPVNICDPNDSLECASMASPTEGGARLPPSKDDLPYTQMQTAIDGYGINTNFPVDWRDSMYRCASAASARGKVLPTSIFSFPCSMSWNDFSIPSRCLSGIAETV